MSFTEIENENAPASPPSSSRRNFLGITAATVVAGVAGSASITTGAAEMAQAQELELQSAPGTPAEHKRQKEAYRIRVEAARRERELPPANHPTNGGGRVTTSTLFRGLTPGDLAGPYISQFLWLDTPFGAERVDRRMRTTAPGVDYMTAYDDWLAVQNGATSGENQYDTIHRYIRNGRDLGEWVHIDVLFQAYFNAMLILFSLGARFDEGNPYNASRTQIGFGTLGAPYIASILCAVARPALKAVWYQKWFVHRRLRPEAFAGRIHNRVTRAANYPVHPEILNSQALNEVFSKNGTYLLPMAFPEGSPTHPSYGAGQRLARP